MAKALKGKHGYLHPNPENFLNGVDGLRIDPVLPLPDLMVRTRKAVKGKNNIAGSNHDAGRFVLSDHGDGGVECVPNAYGLMLRLSRIVVPASHLIELAGPVAYLRRLAGHRRRVKREMAESEFASKVPSKFAMTSRERKAIEAERVSTYVYPSQLIVPGSPQRMLDSIYYDDLVTVSCRTCRGKLLGSGTEMYRVVKYLFDSRNDNDGSGIPKKKLREVLPRTQAVTLRVGESYCPGCVPKGKVRP